jgi:hypothetical protein
MADKLKPCPFCGSNPEIRQVEDDRFELACENLCCAYFGDCFETYDDALLFWNTRKGEEVKDEVS